MARAIRLAGRGLYSTDPNPRVGCVIVKDGTIVGEGWHARAGSPHAELLALRQAGDAARGACVYVNLEPCCHQGRTPPCTGFLVDAGVKRVVAAMPDPNPQVNGGGIDNLRSVGIDVDIGVMQAEAESLNKGFLHRIRHGRPWVRVKIAASLDGRTALRSGESQWITNEHSRVDVHHWRARSSAILTGSGTVLADNPALTVRHVESERQPLRVVVDSNFSTPADARVLTGPGKVLVATANDDFESSEEVESGHPEVVYVPTANRTVDLLALMDQLTRREVNELLVEAGPRLSGAMFEMGLVDEIIVYLAPTVLGDQAKGMLELPGLERLADRVCFDVNDVRRFGDDLRLLLRVKDH